jgi:hypothetical protein
MENKVMQVVGKAVVYTAGIALVNIFLAVIILFSPFYFKNKAGYDNQTWEAKRVGTYYVLNTEMSDLYTYYLTSNRDDQYVEGYAYLCTGQFHLDKTLAEEVIGHNALGRCADSIFEAYAQMNVYREYLITVDEYGSSPWYTRFFRQKVQASFISENPFRLVRVGRKYDRQLYGGLALWGVSWFMAWVFINTVLFVFSIMDLIRTAKQSREYSK